MKLLALDVGRRNIGVAITDDEGKLALRHSVISKSQENALIEIRELVVLEKIEKIVVGLPLSLSGEDSEQTEWTRRFATELRAGVENREVVLVDERFSSKEAERRVAAEGGRSIEAHAEAARLILEQYLSVANML
jgi:putative Holliday junction resolvase